jgi:hypothetical protein
MGYFAIGDWLPIDLSCTMAALAAGTFTLAAIVWNPAFRRPEPRKHRTPSTPGYSVSFKAGFVSTQVSPL